MSYHHHITLKLSFFIFGGTAIFPYRWHLYCRGDTRVAAYVCFRVFYYFHHFVHVKYESYFRHFWNKIMNIYVRRSAYNIQTSSWWLFNSFCSRMTAADMWFRQRWLVRLMWHRIVWQICTYFISEESNIQLVCSFWSPAKSNHALK
jgi:hypothetical protein